MTPIARKALEYVHNAGEGATVAAFLHDHAPIGHRLLRALQHPILLVLIMARVDGTAPLRLTLAGQAALGLESGPASFTCPRCGSTSYNPNDVREQYCGRCHVFVKDAEQAEHQARLFTHLAATTLRLARIVQAQCANSVWHDLVFDVVADLEQLVLDAERAEAETPRPPSG